MGDLSEKVATIGALVAGFGAYKACGEPIFEGPGLTDAWLDIGAAADQRTYEVIEVGTDKVRDVGGSAIGWTVDKTINNAEYIVFPLLVIGAYKLLKAIFE